MSEGLSAEPGDVPDGERKVLTALFADIKGSTALMRELDPEEARAIIDPALRHMIDAVHRYDGYVVQSTGDGIFALFGAPVACEDHPQRALYAALEMQRTLREHGKHLVAAGKEAIEARIGVNTGEVVVRGVATSGRTEYTPIGHTANLAARLQSAAPAGSIAVSDYTRALVEGYFELRALTPAQLKGMDGLVSIYEVIAAGPLHTHFERAARRGLTRFVGRERELAAMLRALERACAGHGQVVAAVAEAGGGKSRLLHEFKAAIAGRAKVMEAYSVSHGKASLWLPVLELLKGYFGIAETDGEQERGDKIAAGMHALDPALEDAIVYLQTLFGVRAAAASLAQMDVKVRQRRTLEAIKRLVLRKSQNQPLVLIFEDLHWIDDDTQALLDVLVDAIANARVLLVVNYRPEYRHQWEGQRHYTELKLERLDQPSAAQMVSALLGDAAELEPLRRLIIDKTDGNPFFIEELVQSLLERNVLRRNGALHLAQPLGDLRVPTTVQGILASRIDHLPPAEKELIGTLAVLGKDFGRDLVAQVASASEAELERMLLDLETGEFIYKEPQAAERRYTFKHALTQEVAYGSMLLERRRRLHAKVAEALEVIHRDRLNQHYDELIRHFTRAGDNLKALQYMGQSITRDLEVSAWSEQTLNYIYASLEMLKSLPESPERAHGKLELHSALTIVLQAVRGLGSDETLAATSRFLELSQAKPESVEHMKALEGVTAGHLNAMELRQACEVAERHLAIAERLGNHVQESQALGQMALALLWAGELSAARRCSERINQLWAAKESPGDLGRELLEHDSPLLRLYFALSAQIGPELLWYLGYPDQAREKSRRALIAGEAAAPFCHVLALIFTLMMHSACRDFEGVRERLERLEKVTDKFGLHPIDDGFARQTRAGLLVADGRPQEAITILVNDPMALSTPILADAYSRAGQVEEALGVINNAIENPFPPENRIGDAEKHRLKGEILLLQRDSDEAQAERCFRTAIEIARRQSAKSWELRATTSLARLLAKQGRRDEAREMLAEIYGWFTEGFDTADLKDAKALLDELSV